MSDLFHEKIPAKFIRRVWNVMAETPRHTYQILTKPPDRLAEVLSAKGWPLLPNVWLGARVEDDRLLYRLDDLRRVPASARFVSFEPRIGSVAGSDARVLPSQQIALQPGDGAAVIAEGDGLRKFASFN